LYRRSFNCAYILLKKNNMKFEQQLKELTSYIEVYNSVSLNDGEQLNYLLQKINTILFYLESERAKYKQLYEIKIYELTTDKKLAVNRAVNFAEVEIPELYLLRRIMDSGYRVSDAIRTNISFLKNERNHSR